MSTNDNGSGTQSGTPAAEGSAALRVASRGISTPRDCTNLAIAGSLDALTGHIGTRNGNLFFRGLGVAQKFIETGQRHGQHQQIANRVQPAQANREQTGETEADALRQEEQELTARLEALRSERTRISGK